MVFEKRSRSKTVFGEVTSKFHNTPNSRKGKSMYNGMKKSHTGSSGRDARNDRESNRDNIDKRYASLDDNPSTDSDGYSYASESQYTYTTNGDGKSCDDDHLSSDYQSSDYASSDEDESCLSYTSTQASMVESVNTRFLKEVKKRTSRADADYRNSEERRLRAIHLVACRHLKNGNLNVSQQKFEEILSTLVEEYGETHKRVGTALHNLGIVHMRTGNYNDAVDAIQAAIRIRMEKLGEYHPKVADSLVELGIVLIHQNEFDRSVEFFNEALAIREIELEEADSNNMKERNRIQLQIAKIHNNIGCAHFEVGEMDDAKDAFECTLDIQCEIHDRTNDKASVPVQLAMSSTVGNLGFVHLENAEWEFASDRLEYALKIQRDILDDSNKLVLNTMEHLGYAYVKYGSYDTSLRVYKEIVDIKKSVHDVDDFTYLDVGDLEVADAMKKLVYCQMKLYKYEDAIDTLSEIEAIQELNYDDDHSQLLKTRELIASVHYDMHKHPGFLELIARNMTLYGFRNPFNSDLLCRCAADAESSDFLPCKPPPPPVRTKMSGHKVSYA